MSNINVFNNDCIKIMDNLISQEVFFDLIVTDPPYLMNYRSNMRKEKYEYIHNDKDSHSLITDFVKRSYTLLKDNSHFYCFCSWHHIDFFKQEIEKHFNIKNIIVWDKRSGGMGDLKGSYAPAHEFCIFATKGRKVLNGKRIPDIITASRTGNKYHSTQKPTDLLHVFIEKSSSEGDTIFDPFMGSGSTGVVCKELNRNFYGVELDENYFRTACERLGVEI